MRHTWVDPWCIKEATRTRVYACHMCGYLRWRRRRCLPQALQIELPSASLLQSGVSLVPQFAQGPRDWDAGTGTTGFSVTLAVELVSSSALTDSWGTCCWGSCDDGTSRGGLDTSPRCEAANCSVARSEAKGCCMWDIGPIGECWCMLKDGSITTGDIINSR